MNKTELNQKQKIVLPVRGRITFVKLLDNGQLELTVKIDAFKLFYELFVRYLKDVAKGMSPCMGDRLERLVDGNVRILAVKILYEMTRYGELRKRLKEISRELYEGLSPERKLKLRVIVSSARTIKNIENLGSACIVTLELTNGKIVQIKIRKERVEKLRQYIEVKNELRELRKRIAKTIYSYIKEGKLILKTFEGLTIWLKEGK